MPHTVNTRAVRVLIYLNKNAQHYPCLGRYNHNMSELQRSLTATKQAEDGRDSKGRFTIGNAPMTGFHTNPERRSNGKWNKEDSISYQYKYLLNMHPDELVGFKPTTVAQRIALIRIRQAMDGNRLGLMSTVEITDRTEGKARQDIGTSIDETAQPIIKGFVIPTLPEDFIDSEGCSNNVLH